MRKFNTGNAIVINVAGVCGAAANYLGDNGPATSALFSGPVGSMVDTLGQVFVCDLNNNLVRRVNSNSIVALISGTSAATNSGDDGPASSASFQTPCGIWFNSVAFMYVTSKNGFVVRTIDSDGIISLFAGKLLSCTAFRY